MIRVKISDNKCLEDIMNDFISSAAELPEVQSQLRDEEEYMKLQATVDSLKEAMAGCPEAALMEAFEDALYWISGYEINAAYLDGIKKGFNLGRFLMDETDRRQQDRQTCETAE